MYVCMYVCAMQTTDTAIFAAIRYIIILIIKNKNRKYGGKGTILF